MKTNRLEETARSIFGAEDPESIQRWVSYWNESNQRNRDLLRSFEDLALLDFSGQKVLDIGCGTGGMAEVIGDRCGFYLGADYHHHVLQFAESTHSEAFVQCSGIDLPFPDQSFDLIIAFDVIEHLVGGTQWQFAFLKELRRVLKPLGTILFTTPNWWAPYDGHTQLYFPHYLPLSVANKYIAWKNPGFLKEHNTFEEIKLMSPRQLQDGLRQSGLCFLHGLPCGLDRPDYIRHFPVRGLLAYLGFGWYPHAEFWGFLVREESRSQLRRKLRKNWYYERNQPSQETIADFKHYMDFDQGLFNHQLDSGWYWHERDEHGFRWTAQNATCYLESKLDANFIVMKGFSPNKNYLRVFVNGSLVGEHPVEKGKDFQLRYLIPFRRTENSILEIGLSCAETFQSEDPDDDRELGVMIFSMGLER